VNFLKNEDIIIGVDLALNKTGLAILNRQNKVLHTELIKVKTGWEYYRKIGYLYETYLSLFDSILTAKPASSILVLEGRLRAGWSGTTLASIEGARVACYLAYKTTCNLHEKDVIHVSYDPAEVKHFIAGKRNAKKEELLEKSVSRFSWLSDIEYQEDIYDAIYIALRHIKGVEDERS
jgi:Holliday junction resolvasome RuvABC endonuclease subunit